MAKNLVIFVDIDDTLIRSFGSKRIPISFMINQIRLLKELGAELFAWSSGGADYARETTKELNIDNCFLAFLPKPNIIIDDQNINDWKQLTQVHPNICRNMTIEDYNKIIDQK